MESAAATVSTTSINQLFHQPLTEDHYAIYTLTQNNPGIMTPQFLKHTREEAQWPHGGLESWPWTLCRVLGHCT